MFTLLAAIIVTLLPHAGFPPLGVRIDVRSAGYDGALCLTLDGPEFHRSCWHRTKTEASVKQLTYTLYTAGVYTVSVDDRTGTRRVGTIEVLGNDAAAPQ